MAAVTAISRFQGATGKVQPYAPTSTPTPYAGDNTDLHLCYAALTGAMTINVTVTKLLQFQKVFWYFTADATTRVVTLGTGFLGAASPNMVGATITIPASLNAVVSTFFDGVALRVVDVQVEGRGETIENTAYGATLEVVDQFARHHIIAPAQLTGALTLNATAVTKWINGDQATFHFSTDGTQRVVTFGTNILSSGTITIPANKTATARGYFNGTSICITGREISA